MSEGHDIETRVGAMGDSHDSPTASKAGGASTVAQHSPLPWRAIDGCLVNTSNGTMSIACDESGVTSEQDEANARFIVQCVNSHNDLIAALKALMADIDTGVLVRDITRDGDAGWSMHMLAFVQRLQAAQAAIAKAEGR